MMRRLAGHAHAQFGVTPSPVGSDGSRRAIWLPACVQQPAKIQQPEAVVPSACNTPKPDSCSPLRARNFPGSLGSGTSATAQPLNSFATSSGEGSAGIL